MSKIHYFQRYSQKENVATNNTLLLFSRLYNHSLYKFNNFLNELLELGEENINVGLEFSQQEKEKSSIPDGIFYQESFKIAIETKMSKHFDESQLINHLNTFEKTEGKKVLIGLSPVFMDENLKRKIIKISQETNNVIFKNLTFKQIISAFREILEDYEFELHNIIDDYEEYCNQSGLIKETEFKMRIVPCGDSFELNKKYNLYFCHKDRSYSDHRYIGIYKEKSVKAVGKVETIVVADIVDNKLVIKENTVNITEGQKEAVIKIITESKELYGWEISKEHRFFIVEQFYSMEFKKISKGGIQGARFKNLKDILDLKGELPETEKIAELLNKKVWE